MRRDIGNEVIVAIAAVAVLAFALAFAILLSLSSGESSEVTATPARNTVVSNVDESESPAPTDVADSASTTPRPPRPPSLTPTSNGDAETAAAATEDKTDQPVGETVTPTDTATSTPTATPTRTPPATDVLANQTLARTPTEDSGIGIPLTPDEPKPTDVPLLATTLPPPTANTNGNEPTATFTPRVTTAPDGILPTPTGAATATSLAVSVGISTTETTIPHDCSRPAGWVTYRVETGNTLFLIAQAVGSNVYELAQANCISNVDRIQAADVLFVPRPPRGPVPTSAVNEHGVLAPMGCQNPDIQIFSPAPGARVSGTVTITGRVVMADFWYYNVEIRPATDSVYRFYSDSRQQVQNGTLETIDTSRFENGQHWLRIAVVNDRGGILDSSICEIPVFFD